MNENDRDTQMRVVAGLGQVSEISGEKQVCKPERTERGESVRKETEPVRVSRAVCCVRSDGRQFSICDAPKYSLRRGRRITSAAGPRPRSRQSWKGPKKTGGVEACDARLRRKKRGQSTAPVAEECGYRFPSEKRKRVVGRRSWTKVARCLFMRT